MHFAMVAKLWGCDAARVTCCVFPFFSSISSPGRMDHQNEVLVALFGNQTIVLPRHPAGAIGVNGNFHHTSGNISVEGSSANNGGAVLWRAPLELLGTASDVCGDFSLLDTLLGPGKTLRINSCRSKRRFEGIWTDVSCIFDCTFALISISENCISIVEHGDCSPLDQLLGSWKETCN